MALSEKLKKRLAGEVSRIEKQRDGSGLPYYSMEKDKVRLIVLPNPADHDEDFYVKSRTHFRMPDPEEPSKTISLRCPKDHGDEKSCKSCKTAKSIVEDQPEAGKHLFGSMRGYIWVIDMDDLESGVQLYNCPISVLNDVIKQVFEYGDVLPDLGNGEYTARGLRVTRKKTGKQAWNVQYAVMPDIELTKVSKKIVRAWLDQFGEKTWNELLDSANPIDQKKMTKSVEMYLEDADLSSDADGDDGEEEDDRKLKIKKARELESKRAKADADDDDDDDDKPPVKAAKKKKRPSEEEGVPAKKKKKPSKDYDEDELEADLKRLGKDDTDEEEGD